jgi:hypothetical protein
MGPRADAFIAGPFLALPADEDREGIGAVQRRRTGTFPRVPEA